MAAAKKPEKPRKRKAAKRTARRPRIAAGVVAGKSQTAIAAEEGVSRAWVNREANSAETRQIIAGLIEQQLDRVARLFDRTLTAIEEAFDAETVSLVTTKTKSESKKGKKETTTHEVVSLGRDHYARLTAARRLVELLTAGRPTPRPAEEHGDHKAPPSWAEIRALFSSSRADTPAT